MILVQPVHQQCLWDLQPDNGPRGTTGMYQAYRPIYGLIYNDHLDINMNTVLKNDLHFRTRWYVWHWYHRQLR